MEQVAGQGAVRTGGQAEIGKRIDRWNLNQLAVNQHVACGSDPTGDGETADQGIERSLRRKR